MANVSRFRPPRIQHVVVLCGCINAARVASTKNTSRPPSHQVYILGLSLAGRPADGGDDVALPACQDLSTKWGHSKVLEPSTTKLAI
eukprot:1185432-Prorocentrum_minimum.AAC.4